jgi:hypothetical protein
MRGNSHVRFGGRRRGNHRPQGQPGASPSTLPDGSATELIGKERSGNAELALLLVAPGKRAPIPQCSHASVATERGVVDLGP